MLQQYGIERALTAACDGEIGAHDGRADAVAKKARLNTVVVVQHRSARTSPSLSQDQRLAWIHELLTGASESLPYRVAGMLLLLYAQPLVKVVTFPTSIVDDSDTGMSITLGQHPTDVPEPFASLVREHLAARPNLRTGAGPDSPWLFPSTLAGRHLHPNTVMDRLRYLGVNLLGARNRAIGELVLECPPSLVAEALGYSPQVAFLYADKAAEPWARYAGRSVKSPLTDCTLRRQCRVHGPPSDDTAVSSPAREAIRDQPPTRFAPSR